MLSLGVVPIGRSWYAKGCLSKPHTPQLLRRLLAARAFPVFVETSEMLYLSVISRIYLQPLCAFRDAA